MPEPVHGAIVHFLYEPGDGGLDRVSILLANGMAERGLPAELWLSKMDGPLADLIAPAVTVRQVPTPQIGGRSLRLVLQIPALTKMIRRHAPGVILSAGNQSNLSLALARKLAGATGMRIIQKLTNPIVRPTMGRLRGYLRHLRFALTFRLGDACLTLSEADASELRQSMAGVAGRFHAVCNAYVTREMLDRGMARSVRAPNTPVRLLSVGRLAVQKDHATLLHALARLSDVDWRLRILGDGPLLDESKELAARLEIADRITFEGFVPDAGPAYQGSDLLILSSRWEGFPAVPLEAMASGCKVVATDCSPGLSEIMRETGGFPVPIGDHSALSDAIREAIVEHDNATNLRDVAMRYSLSASVNDHLRLIALIDQK